MVSLNMEHSRSVVRGGAMVYVVLAHLLPDAMQAESRYAALAAFITGIAIAYGLSVVFGL